MAKIESNKVESEELYPKKISFWMIFRGRALIGFPLIFILFLVSIFAALYDPDPNNDFLGVTLFFFLILIFGMAGNWLNLKAELIKGFAISKGMKAGFNFDRNINYPESIIKLGNYRKKQIYYSNPEGTKSIEIVYITKHGRKKDTDTIAGRDVTLISSRLHKIYPFAQALNKQLQLRPKHIIKRELHTTESNQFNELYYLNADEPEDAFYVFNPATINEIITQKNDISVEVCGDTLSVFTSSPIKNINDLENIWNAVLKIQDTLE